jgi:quinoprotein glucose dehydrogenase
VLACVRCHRATADGGDAGPNLGAIGATYSREYLLQSIVKPSAKIAPGFETAAVTLKSGAVRAGTIATEDTTTLTLKLPDNTLEKMAKSEIAKREAAPSSMPDIYAQLLTKSDLRDLVEYLASLRTPPAILGTESGLRALRGMAKP